MFPTQSRGIAKNEKLYYNKEVERNGKYTELAEYAMAE